MTIEEEIRNLARLRRLYDELRTSAAEAKLDYDRAHQALWDRMDATGVDGMKIDGMTYSKNKQKPYSTVQDKDALYRWAVEEGNMPELFDPQPRGELLNETVRQRLDNGEAMPPGVGWYPKHTVSQRKS